MIGVYEPTAGYLTSHRTIRTYGRIQITVNNGGLELRSWRGPWREGVRMVQSDLADPTLLLLDTGEAEPSRVLLLLDETKAVAGIRIDPGHLMMRNDKLTPWA